MPARICPCKVWESVCPRGRHAALAWRGRGRPLGLRLVQKVGARRACYFLGGRGGDAGMQGACKGGRERGRCGGFACTGGRGSRRRRRKRLSGGAAEEMGGPCLLWKRQFRALSLNPRDPTMEFPSEILLPSLALDSQQHPEPTGWQSWQRPTSQPAHLTQENTEALGGEMTCPGSYTTQIQEQDPDA